MKTRTPEEFWEFLSQVLKEGLEEWDSDPMLFTLTRSDYLQMVYDSFVRWELRRAAKALS